MENCRLTQNVYNKDQKLRDYLAFFPDVSDSLFPQDGKNTDLFRIEQE